MNETKFISKYNEYNRTIPARGPEDSKKIQKLIEGMVEDAKGEHALTYKSQHMSDWVVCSCGWKSDGFWDGMEYARRQWQDHVFHEITDPVGE